MGDGSTTSNQYEKMDNQHLEDPNGTDNTNVILPDPNDLSLSLAKFIFELTPGTTMSM